MDVEKKRKRGKRGGKNKEVPQATTTEVVAESAKHEESIEEPKRKKTRRSKKKAVEEEAPIDMDVMEFQEASKDAQEPELDHETRHYFLEIEKQLQNEFESEEDLSLFVGNVFEEVDGKEMLLACDYEGSRILEKLLKLSNDFQIRVFGDRLHGCYFDLIRHSFGSHVCQTLLNLGSITVEREVKGFAFQPEGKKEETAELPTMEALLLSIATELEVELMDAIFHSYASHVIRTLLNVLAGNSLTQDSKMRSKKSAKYNQNHDNTWKVFNIGIDGRTELII
jgi:nucleolar protein 9